jgi:hypothetical protein
VARRNETDPLNGSRLVDLKDGYLQWSPRKYAQLRVGQFKAPFNGETLLGDGYLPFVSRSVISDGLLPPETNNGRLREGLALDRQVGAQIGSDRLGDPGSIGFRYAVAVMNGNGANALNNDNNSVMPVGRVVVEFKDMVALGVNGYLNDVTEGERPNRLTSGRIGYGGDLSAHIAGADLLLSVLSRSTSHPGTGLPNETGFGLMGSVHYLHESSGFEGGLRYASLDPSNVETDDAVNEINVMVGFRPKQVPLRLLVQYSLRGEDVPQANNSLDAMVQLSW